MAQIRHRLLFLSHLYFPSIFQLREVNQEIFRIFGFLWSHGLRIAQLIFQLLICLLAQFHQRCFVFSRLIIHNPKWIILIFHRLFIQTSTTRSLITFVFIGSADIDKWRFWWGWCAVIFVYFFETITGGAVSIRFRLCVRHVIFLGCYLLN